ncbi:MAG: hypothetical protein ABIQ90_08075 [Polaromonas sp.]
MKQLHTYRGRLAIGIASLVLGIAQSAAIAAPVVVSQSPSPIVTLSPQAQQDLQAEIARIQKLPKAVMSTVVSGKVTGDLEKVFFPKVKVDLASRLILIEDGTKKVSLDIAFVDAQGIGAKTGQVYLSTYTDPDLLKLLPARGVVLKLEQTFAFGKESTPLVEDQFGLLTLTLYIDGNGVINHAEGKIGDLPVFK